VSIQH